MDNVWGGRFVSETAVTSRIKQARQAIGDDGQAQRLIRTLHGHGYRFVAACATRPSRVAARRDEARSTTRSAMACRSRTRSPGAAIGTSCWWPGSFRTWSSTGPTHDTPPS